MVTVPPPLYWMILSAACCAPPPSISTVVDDDVPSSVSASSPTSSHQTFRSVQLPAQWIPSADGLPRTTFDKVAPLASMNIGFCPSVWLPSPSEEPAM